MARAIALRNLGMALPKAGRPGEAITSCQDAAAIFRQQGDQHNGRVALGDLDAATGAQQAGG